MQATEVPSPQFSSTSLFVKALKCEVTHGFNTLLNWIFQPSGKEGTFQEERKGHLLETRQGQTVLSVSRWWSAGSFSCNCQP